LAGVVPLRVLLDRTDAARVWLEMDLFWTVAGGVEPATLFAAYPHRYRLLHLKDMAKAVHFSGDGGDAQQWIELFPHMTTAGDGVLNLRAIVQQAIRAGVRHFIVEQDRVEQPERALRRSHDFLAAL
jgi:sugar phosphate isomerase/epimerase